MLGQSIKREINIHKLIPGNGTKNLTLLQVHKCCSLVLISYPQRPNVI